MPKITAVQRQARRQEILDAAVRCFSRDGFHATTTADIVREAGVSQGVLYLYFATKDDIIVALGDDRRHGEAFVTALAEKEHDPVEGLLALIQLYGKRLGSPAGADLQRVGVQGWGEALRNPRIRANIREGVGEVRAAIVKLIQRGQRTGQVRADIDPDAVSRVLVATFHGIVLQVVWDDAPDLAACGRTMRAIIRDSLLTDAGRAHLSLAPDSLTHDTPA